MGALLTLAFNPAAWAAVGVSFLAGFFAAFGVMPKVDIPAIVRNAENARDAVWQRKILEVNEDHAEKLRAAVAERDATPVIAADADLDELCGKSPSCRDKAAVGKHGLRSVPADKLGKARHKADGAANHGS
jgi:hypothetical protein